MIEDSKCAYKEGHGVTPPKSPLGFLIALWVWFASFCVQSYSISRSAEWTR